jgi:hypothetical protein
MRRGQAMTMDLFAAMAVFMIVLLIVILFATSMSEAKLFNDNVYRIEGDAVAAQDYIAMGEATSNGAYVLDKAAVDAMFARSEASVGEELGFQTNHSIQIIRLSDGATVLETGSNSTFSKYSVAVDRFVVYDGQLCVMRLALWGRGAFT